jgi:hypothetical protein
VFVLFFLSLPMFVLFTGAYCVLTASGKLDWLGWSRTAQYSFVALSCLALTAIMAAAAAVHGSNLHDLPWTLRAVATWAAIVVPAALAAIGFLWLNSTATRGNTLARAFVGMSTAGIAAVGIALVVQFVSVAASTAQQDQLKIETLERKSAEEDSQNLTEARAADPEKDFVNLLALANRYHTAETRKIALQKILSTGPMLTPKLTEALQSEMDYRLAMRFLRDNEVPDPAAVATPVRDAILLSAKLVRDGSLRYADDIDAEGELILDVAGSAPFAKSGVDYVSPIREFRAALDTVYGAPKKPQFACRSSIDRWLKQQR